MLGTPDHGDARLLRSFLTDEGYTEQGLLTHLHAVEACVPRARNRARMLDLTVDATPHNVLVRWFIAGEPVEEGMARKVVPAPVLGVMLECGLVASDGTALVPQVLIQPQGELLIAADPFMRHELGAEDYVLGVSPPGRWLLDFLVRRRASRALDLCAGCAVHGITLAREHDVVVATDQNPRATAYARFNAALNGTANVECRTGDRFVPVAGERFDTIVSNPPFFVTPGRRFIYRDNPFELDAFCRHVVQSAPEHLEDGGYFQAICEWVQVAGEPAEARLAEWFHGSSCDVWVLHVYSMDPSWYAQTRLRESPEASPGADAQTYEEWVGYLRERRVEAVHGGLIAMRRREDALFGHALRIETLREPARGAIGDAVIAAFAGMELLAERAAADVMLGARLRVRPDVRLETVAAPIGGEWQPQTVVLRQATGLRRAIELAPSSAGALALLDGTRTIGEVCREMAQAGGVTLDRVEAEMLRACRRLIELGFLGR
jgi:methylase of polypeptide subunit release factors